MIAVMQGNLFVGTLAIPEEKLPRMGDEIVLEGRTGNQRVYRVLRIRHHYKENGAAWGEDYYEAYTVDTEVQVEPY